MLYISKLPETWAHTRVEDEETLGEWLLCRKLLKMFSLSNEFVLLKLSVQMFMLHPSSLQTCNLNLRLKLSLCCSCQHVTLAINQFICMGKQKLKSSIFFSISEANLKLRSGFQFSTQSAINTYVSIHSAIISQTLLHLLTLAIFILLLQLWLFKNLITDWMQCLSR